VEIRKAAAGEAESLSALAREAKAHWGYSREDLESWRDQLRVSPSDLASKPIYLAAINGDVAGFYSLVPAGRAWELDHLWVAPRFIRRGVGRTLLAHALEVAFRGGASSVTVDADPNAESFYLSCGAVRCGEVPAPVAGQPHRVRPQLFWNSEDRVQLVDPDSSWPAQYKTEADALRSILPPASGMRLEHFGSTAVPGLRAKPIIDILVIHPEPALWPALVGTITSAGYAYWAENPRKDRMFFVKGMPPSGARRTHHVHVRLPGDAQAELEFRDLLRADPGLVRRYAMLKEELAARFSDDREAYTEGKTEFVANALGQFPKR
jgi:GrpB-like predicted nucleotidyltransferase (UPF0157 family)/GNAT superfamily N-acetyltransferase